MVEMEKRLSKEELEKRIKWYEARYGSYIKKTGLHNWKNLFRKPTFYEWVILAMLILALFGAWAYKQDIKSCQEFLINQTRTYEQILNDSGFNLSFNIIQGGGNEEK